jgi:hypothetical protein
MLSIAILIFYPSATTSFTNMLKPFTFPICYIMGCSILDDREKIDRCDDSVRKIIYVIVAGTVTHFFLNMIINIGAENRETLDFWSRKVLSATGQATLVCVAIGVIAAFFFSNVGVKKKLIATVLLAIIIVYNLVLAGRTIFVLILILLALAFFYNLRSNNNSKKIKTVLFVALGVCLLIIIYNIDAFGIKTAFENSNFYDRFTGEYSQELDDDKRLEYKLYYLKEATNYFWGGNNIHNVVGHYAHDLYFDTYDDAGIFALLGVVLYIIASLGRMISCLRSRYLSFNTKQLVLCVYVVINIQFWLEPILQGSPWLLASYCLIDGAVTQLLKKEKDIYKE